jgi:hypothetical protein
MDFANFEDSPIYSFRGAHDCVREFIMCVSKDFCDGRLVSAMVELVGLMSFKDTSIN